MVLPLRNKSLTDKKFQINSLYLDQNLVSNLDGHVTIAPCLFQNAMELVRNQRKSYLKQEIMHGETWQEKLLQVIQTIISGREKCFTIITEENGDTLSAILNDKIIIELSDFLFLT